MVLLRDVPRIRPAVSALRDGIGTVLWTGDVFYSVISQKYGFNVGVEAFTGGTGATGSADALAHETAAPVSGAGSLRVTRSWGSGTDYATARGPQVPSGSRDWRGLDADALGARVLVPAGAPGLSWSLQLRVENTAGTVVMTTAQHPLQVGVATRVWVPTPRDVLADVARVEVLVYANGVNASQHVLVDDIATGKSGALHPEQPEQPGSGTLWETTFAGADPKANLKIEASTESDAANLSFPAVGGVQRARVAWPVVGGTLGYKGRARFSDLSVAARDEVFFECGVVLPAALKSDLASRDCRMPSLAGIPEGQPGTYTSIDGTLKADSWSAPLHLKASGGGVSRTVKDEQFNRSDTLTSAENTNAAAEPFWWVVQGFGPYTVNGTVLQYNTGSNFGRIGSKVRFGGPGTRTRLRYRARINAFNSTSWTGIRGLKFGMRYPSPNNTTYPADDPRSVFASPGDSERTGQAKVYVPVDGMTEQGHYEVAELGYDSEQYSFHRTGAPAKVVPTLGQWYEKSIEVDQTTGGRITFRFWDNGTASGAPKWTVTDSTNVPLSPGYLWIRGDYVQSEIDWLVVEEVGGVGKVWAEATCYAPRAGGKVYPDPDIYGLTFPLRPDLVPDHTGDRTTWWEPPADREFHLRHRIKMNTPGATDGEWDIWADGVQVLRLRDVEWRAAGQTDLRINQVLQEVFFTQGGGATATDRVLDLTYERLGSVAALPPPGTPSNLAAGTVTTTSVPLTWTAGSNATSHTLLRDGAVIATGLSTSYTDTGLSPATTYVYAVRAVNAAGTSTPTADLSVTTAAGTVTQQLLPPDPFTTAFAAKWTTVNAEASVVSDAGRITYSTAFPHIQTDPQDWTGKRGFIEALNTAPANTRHYYNCRVDGFNYYWWMQYAGELRVQRNIANAFATPFSMAFDPVAHRFWAIRESGGDVIFETSPDRATWTERYREAAQINMTVARERIMAYTSVAGTAGFFNFDNNNVMP